MCACSNHAGGTTLKLHDKDVFLAMARGFGLTLDPRYPLGKTLMFDKCPHLGRFWDYPWECKGGAEFLAALLEAVEPWESCFVWRHLDSWPQKSGPNERISAEHFQALCDLGLAVGTDEVVEFESSERNDLAALLYTTMRRSGPVADDLYLIPDNGRYTSQPASTVAAIA